MATTRNSIPKSRGRADCIAPIPPCVTGTRPVADSIDAVGRPVVA